MTRIGEILLEEFEEARQQEGCHGPLVLVAYSDHIAPRQAHLTAEVLAEVDDDEPFDESTAPPTHLPKRKWMPRMFARFLFPHALEAWDQEKAA